MQAPALTTRPRRRSSHSLMERPHRRHRRKVLHRAPDCYTRAMPSPTRRALPILVALVSTAMAPIHLAGQFSDARLPRQGKLWLTVGPTLLNWTEQFAFGLKRGDRRRGARAAGRPLRRSARPPHVPSPLRPHPGTQRRCGGPRLRARNRGRLLIRRPRLLRDAGADTPTRARRRGGSPRLGQRGSPGPLHAHGHDGGLRLRFPPQP